MHHKTGIFLAGLIIATGLAINAKTPIGKESDWANTIAATVFKGNLYTVEKGGELYMTIPASGAWKQIGKPDFANTLFLLTLPDKLMSIEKDGSIFLIESADGSWRQSGKTGDWVGTIAAAVLNGRLYTVEQSGTLYVTTPSDGIWKKIGNPDFANTLVLFALKDKLVSIEKDGSIYLINPMDGSWRRSGKAGELNETAAGAICGATLYTVATDGTLSATDPETGTRRTVNTDYSGTTFLLPVGQELYAISDSGNLSLVSPADSAKSAPAPEQVKQEETNPALAGQLTFKFMGQWKGDPAELEKDPEFQRQKTANPQMLQALVNMMKDMTMKVTLDGITMTVMGETVGPFPFEAISASGNTLLIENKEGPKKGVQSKIVFRSDKQIQIIEGNNESKAMFFRKN